MSVDAINAITIYVNGGNGTFPTTTSILSGGAVAIAADFTGDGAPDITGRTGVLGGQFALYINRG
jgi:hypothetical protein